MMMTASTTSTNTSDASHDISHLVSKFSALECPSATRCRALVQVSTVYDAYHRINIFTAMCDFCNSTLLPHDVVLHCPPNARHIHGFDLCVQCADKMLVKQQQSILRSVDKLQNNKRKTNSRPNADSSSSSKKGNRSRTETPGAHPVVRDEDGIHRAVGDVHPPLHMALGTDESSPNLETSTDNNNNTSTSNKHPGTGNTQQQQHKKYVKKKRARSWNEPDANKSSKRSKLSNSTPSKSPPAQTQNAPQEVKPQAPPGFADWKQRTMDDDDEFANAYIQFLRTTPKMGNGSIDVLNTHCSWLDHGRVQHGPEKEALCTLFEFGDVVPRASTHLITSRLTGKLSSQLDDYLISADVDNQHIWQFDCDESAKRKSDLLTAKYATHYIAHNSVHQTLFGAGTPTSSATSSSSSSLTPGATSQQTQTQDNHETSKDGATHGIDWQSLSRLTEQAHFVHDWKLHQLDALIEKQINVLQALIAQNASERNNLHKNDSRLICNQSDADLAMWKLQIIKLRKLRQKHDFSMEFPMHVLCFDRNQVDDLAKVAAIDGIQCMLQQSQKISARPLPSTAPCLSRKTTSLKIRDLLPGKIHSTTRFYRAPASLASKAALANRKHAILKIGHGVSKQQQQQKKKVPSPQSQQAETCADASTTTLMPVPTPQSATVTTASNVKLTMPHKKQNLSQPHQSKSNHVNHTHTHTANMPTPIPPPMPMTMAMSSAHNHNSFNRITTTTVDNNHVQPLHEQPPPRPPPPPHLPSQSQSQTAPPPPPQAMSSFANGMQLMQSMQPPVQEHAEQQQPYSMQQLDVAMQKAMAQLSRAQQQNSSNSNVHSDIEILKVVSQQHQQQATDQSSPLNPNLGAAQSLDPNVVYNTLNFLNSLKSPLAANLMNYIQQNLITQQNQNNNSTNNNNNTNTHSNLGTSNSTVSANINTNHNHNNTMYTLTNRKRSTAGIRKRRNVDPKLTRIDLTDISPPPITTATAASLNRIMLHTAKRNNESPPIDTNEVAQAYSELKYWVQFHNDQDEDFFEWFCCYEDIRSVLTQHIVNRQARIMEIGSGLSAMASKMVLEDGYTNITCLDWCDNAIEKIKRILLRRYTTAIEQQLLQTCLTYQQHDIRELASVYKKTRQFDVIIDKGTLDAIDCGATTDSERSRWNVSDNFEEIVLIGKKIHELLKKDGLFIMVTSRSIQKRVEFVDEVKSKYSRLFQQIYAAPIHTELRDWRDGDTQRPKIIILKAKKEK